MATAPALGTENPREDRTVGLSTFDYPLARGDRTPLIYDGSEVANPGWIAALFHDDAYICTASLIDQQVVLTAAHCVQDPGNYSVLIGEEYLYASGITRAVAEIFVHPGYVDSDFDSTDLALLALDAPVTSVPIASLNAVGEWPELGQVLSVAGWGSLYEGSGLSPLLQAAVVYATSGMDGTFDPSYCDLDPTARTVGGMFCFGGPVTAEACAGDSGGPVMGFATPTADSGDRVIYGVVAYGDPYCGVWISDDKAQSVGGHDPWIRSVVDLITDVPPEIAVTKSAQPSSVPETGGLVTFTVTVENNSTETATLESLTDDIYGNLDGQGTCSLPQGLAASDGTNGSGPDLYACSFTATVAGDYPGSETDTVTAIASDDQGNTDTQQASATVTYLAQAPPLADELIAVNSTSGEIIPLGLVSRAGSSTPAIDQIGPSTYTQEGIDVVWGGYLGGPSGADVLLYDRDTGWFQFRTVAPDGSTSPFFEGFGTRGWSHVIPGDYNGDGIADLLFYRARDGLMRFYTVSATGRFAPMTPVMYGTRGWTQMIPGDFDNNGTDDLMWYRAGDGLMRFYTVTASGRFAPMTPVMYGTRNWDVIPSGDFDDNGRDDLLYYRSRDGLHRFYTVSASGRLTPISTTGYASTGWDQILSGEFNGGAGADLVFYQPTTIQIFAYSPTNLIAVTNPTPASSSWVVGVLNWKP